jgi:nucleotide-binding universal stress UspA family protein
MKTFNNILYVIEDPAAESVDVVKRVISLARNNQARLRLLHVADEPRLGPFTGKLAKQDMKARLQARATELLRTRVQQAGGDPDTVIEVRFGPGFIEVVRQVLRDGHDLVIKSAGKGGHHSFLYGGTDHHLLRKCPCPVWILAHETRANYAQVLAAVDFDPWEEDTVENELNRRILDFAASLAVTDFAQLHIVHAWEPITDNVIRVFGSDLSESEHAANREKEWHERQTRLDLLDQRMRKHFGDDTHGYLSPRFHLRRGDPRDVIPAVATELDADLVVMGTVSRTGIPGLLIGNTAEVILNNLECSVLAVKPEGFITPVTLD